MKLIQVILVCTLILFSTSALAAKKSVAKNEKVLICHVGSDVGPGGEVYLDDPSCVPGESNDYFCPDAGKVDLIVVSKNAKHLGNKAHTFDGFSDYEPGEVGASGEGTEDSNGDGIDDGCEPAEVCPCWSSMDLNAVTADNINSASSCDNVSVLPGRAGIENVEGSNPDAEGGFIAVSMPGFEVCLTRDYAPGFLPVTTEEADTCVAQIAQRCAAIGSPIPTP